MTALEVGTSPTSGSPITFLPGAPFNAEQRAWLAGFLAGAASQIGTSPGAGDAPEVQIWFGTQTGNAEAVAGDLAEALGAAGMRGVVRGLDDVTLDDLTSTRLALVVTSTYGEGEMPDNAELFWEMLAASDMPRCEELSFAVLALGDTGYDEFCQAGKLIDLRLEQLGAVRLVARADCDVDFEDLAATWTAEVVEKAGALVGAGGGAATPGGTAPKKPRSKWNRSSPYASRVVVNQVLSGPGSAKENRHIELDLADSGIAYEAGDALAVVPCNDPVLVSALLSAVGADADSPVADDERPLGQVLREGYEISVPSRDLIAEIGRRAGDPELEHLLARGDKTALETWLWGRDVLDLLGLLPEPMSIEDLLPLLRPLQHRQYSISSSPRAHEGRVHLTVAAVRYEASGRIRGGVCSTHLADRLGPDDPVGIFLTPNAAFRLPDDDVPVVMIGPGTGIAPFRGFLHERAARGATGRNWLFFGDQHQAHDFAYEEELAQFSESGLLTRLDLAFSRDQEAKVYVQDRMLENGRELFAWLEEGAHLYVCGDASRMAKDVDGALHRVIAEHGGRDAEAAAAYVNDLKRAKRYARDVY